MRILHCTLLAAGILVSGHVMAHETVPAKTAPNEVSMPAATQAPDRTQTLPVRLSTAELDRVTAGDLVLPNDKVMFWGFDNAAPGEFHPNFDRSPTAVEASGNNEGPWNAAFNSPAIDFQCSIC